MIRLPGPDGDELLCGAKEIAAFIGRSVDATKRLLEAELLPAFRLRPGGRWYMRKASYRSFVAEREVRAPEEKRTSCGKSAGQ